MSDAVDRDDRLEAVAPGVRRVLAPNPGPMTLEGTNTYALQGDGELLVVDPGPLDEAHLDRVAALGPVALVVLTHGHLDHSEGAEAFAARTGAAVTARDPGLCRGAEPLTDGGTVGVRGLEVQVLATPGHSPDSASLLVPSADAVLTGDAVLGRGPSVVLHPEGRVGEHLASLRRLLALPDRPVRLLPGHGPVRTDGLAKVEEDLAHRLTRLRQVQAALDAGAETVDDVLDVVYADVDPALREAAAVSVQASLHHLRGD